MNREFIFLGDYDLRSNETDGIKFIKDNKLKVLSDNDLFIQKKKFMGKKAD